VLEVGELEEAGRIIKEAVKACPRDARPYNLLGEYWYRKGKKTETIKAWRTSLRLNDDQRDMHYILAKLLVGAPHSFDAEQEAIGHAEKAIGMDSARAVELSALFKQSALRARLDAIGAELRTNEALAKAGLKPGAHG